MSIPENILNEVQKKIFGQRSENLTPLEINNLFQLPITPDFNLTIHEALENKAIDPDVSLLQAIPRAKIRDYLIPIALCLRYGADANMYVEAPRVGIIHILGYVYTILGNTNIKISGMKSDPIDENILNTIVLMLIAQGSLPSLPIFDSKGGKIREYTEKQPTVREWLNEQGYSSIINRVGSANELQKTVDKDSLAILSILLDKDKLISRDYKDQDLSLAIRCFSVMSLDKIPISNVKNMLDFKYLEDSVTYLNSNAYQKLLNSGQMPSYVLINKILTDMRVYKNIGKFIAVNELERMLLSSVSFGTQLDQAQLNMISTMGNNIHDSVMKDYEQPYWRKICKSPSKEIPERLQKLAISLNIDPTLNKSSICENITELSKADKEVIKESSKRRQQIRLAANLGHINDFIGENIPTMICRNKALLPHDPFEYNDIDIAYYRDVQGAIWCFTRDSFISILETGLNPYNSTVLPESFKEELKYKVNILERLGIDVNFAKPPVTFTSAVDSLTSHDSISEKSSEHIINLFIQRASENNISSTTVRSLAKQNMIDALRSIGYNIDLSTLSTQHSLITTAYIVVNLDSKTTSQFFNTLNSVDYY